MHSIQEISTTRREYTFKTWIRAFLLVFGLSGVGLSVFLFWSGQAHHDKAMGVFLAPYSLLAGIYFMALLLRSRLTIDGNRVEVRGVFRTKSADLSDIQGFRTFSTRNGKYLQLIMKEGRGKITFSASFATEDHYRAWLQQIPDLDAIDRQVVLDEIAQQQDLGSTPDERLAALAKAKQTNIALGVVVAAAAIGLNWGPANLQSLSAFVLAFTPIAVFLLVQRSPLLYSVFKTKTDPRGDLGWALLFAGFGLIMHGDHISFVSNQQLFMVVLLVAVVFLAAFFRTVSGSNSRWGRMIALLMAAYLYCHGVVVEANTFNDQSKASTYQVSVTGKHSTSGRSTSYYLRLAPWGPIQEPNQLSVTSSIYRGIEAGDQVCLGLHEGRLHLAWYQLTDCPAEPQQQPAQ